MKFNIMAPLIFIITIINFSIDSIMDDRFQDERKRARKRDEVRTGSVRDDSPHSQSGQSHEKNDEKSFLNKVKWMLEYNRFGPIVLVINLTYIMVLIYLLTKSAIYSIYPHKRDDLTGEFKHPVLRFLEAHYFIDCMSIFKKSGQFNKLLTLMISYILIIRLRSLYKRFTTAQYNRREYRKFSTVDLNCAYMIQMETDWSGWFGLAYNCLHHKCQVGNGPWRTRKMTEKLDDMDRIDRMYYYNLIDYNQCYEGLNFFKEPNEVGISKLPSTFRISKIKQWLKKLFTIQEPTRHLFVPQPAHRFDPSHLLIQLGVYTYTWGTTVPIYFASFNFVWFLYLREQGLDLSDVCNTIWPAIENLSKDVKHIISIIDGSLLVTSNFLQVTEISLIVMSSLFCYSRVLKVSKLLKNEVDFYRLQIERNRCYNLTTMGGKRYVHERLHSSHIDHDEYSHYSAKNISMRNKLQADTVKSSFDHWAPGDTTMKWLTNNGTNHHHNADYDSFAEQNENIRYLLSLIEILTYELQDLKRDFTLHINLTIIFGTVGSAIGFSLLASARNITECIVIALVVASNLGPVMCDLILGAIAEGGVSSVQALRNICRLLVPLMVNECKLVSGWNVSRIQILYAYLAHIHNRSFIVLGKFPLTFGSVPTISGWIATINLILQRFFS